MFEYDKYVMAAAKELDKYDFSQILKACYIGGLRSPWEIMEKIMDRHPELGIVDSALDTLSTDEFMEYLSKRYPVYFEEVITYRMCCK